MQPMTMPAMAPLLSAPLFLSGAGAAWLKGEDTVEYQQKYHRAGIGPAEGNFGEGKESMVIWRVLALRREQSNRGEGG